MIKKNVTINDVAKYAGVSRSMVSYVLCHGERGSSTPETREKIYNAVKALGYRVNHTARSLRSGKTRNIGVVLPSLQMYLYELIVELEKSFRKYDYTLTYNFFERARTNLDGFIAAMERQFQTNVDAVITPSFEYTAPSPVPIIIWGNKVPGFDCVFVDKETYGHDVIRRLLSLGHRKIAVCGRLTEVRYKGMRDELAAHGLDFYARLSTQNDDLQQRGIAAIREIAALKELPDVIIFHDDELALSAVGAAFDSGWKIPDDISVVSYGRTPLSGAVRPTLATYDIDWKRTADMLASVTLKRLENPEMPFQQMSVTAEFVPGNSLKNKTV